MKRIPVNEQETTIQFDRDGEMASIWTSDSTVMTKLDKLVSDPESPWECTRTDVDELGWVVCRAYQCPKWLISFKSKKRTVSDSQRAILAQRLKEYRENSDSNPSEDN